MLKTSVRARLRHALAQTPDQLQPAAAGHGQVGDGEVRCLRGKECAAFVRVAGLRHHLHVAFKLQQVAVAGPHHRVVVDEQQADHARPLPRFTRRPAW
nr:hypothetical protein [Variovorax sp. OV329]